MRFCRREGEVDADERHNKAENSNDDRELSYNGVLYSSCSCV